MKLWEHLYTWLGRKRPAFRGGAYSLLLTAVVLAILVVINCFVSALPSGMTRYDISASQLYSITGNTKSVVNSLEQDVTIYWIVQTGQEDDVIEHLLETYDSLSDHIRLLRKDPDVFPTFAEQYTSEAVQNNSLIVESGERSRYISFDDIYLQDADLYSYSYNTSFDGEGAITSAIDYVVRDELPQLYCLEGHGEAELPDAFREQIEKENIDLHTLSLLTVDAIPADADAILIYSPASDISPEEETMLADYAEKGGNLLMIAGPTEDGVLVNLYHLLSDYGVQVCDGIVVEADREHYAFQTPHILLPDLLSHEITDPLLEEKYSPILPISSGLTVSEKTGKGTVTELLTTSDTAYSKLAGYSLDTYDREEGDLDGPFALAVSIDTDGGGKILCFTSSVFLDELYNAYSSGANLNLAMNALSSLMEDSETMAIRSKSLNYNYLTINDAAASLLKVMMVGIFPLVYLGTGIGVVIKRRGLQHEAR